jgi:NADP-dependent 3-hydroxy acid dehydrogenase YdfG
VGVVNSLRIEDQTCIVTGATSGIGKAIALALASTGMALGLVGRDADRLEGVSSEARRHAGHVETYQADLLFDDDICKIASNVKEHFGGVDVLVHCAGIFRMGAISHSPVADLDLLYRTNVRAPYAITQAMLPLICSRQGQIVFVNSSVGVVARAGVAAYAASKHALKAIADALRAQVNEEGVRVITVYPGRTATPQQMEIYKLEGKQYRADRLLQPEDVATAVLNALAMPRTAELTDIHIRPMQKA